MKEHGLGKINRADKRYLRVVTDQIANDRRAIVSGMNCIACNQQHCTNEQYCILYLAIRWEDSRRITYLLSWFVYELDSAADCLEITLPRRVSNALSTPRGPPMRS